MVKKAAKKPAKKKAAGKTPNKAKPTRDAKPTQTPVAAAGPTMAASSSGLSKPEVKRIQGLFKSKRDEGVTLGLSLLESIGATSSDYEAVFSETVIKSVLRMWEAESWKAVASILQPDGAAHDLFQKIADTTFPKRPEKLGDFKGLLYIRMPLARARFLETWGGLAKRKNPFIDLINVPAGTFTMGSPVGEQGRSGNESQVKVRITKSFELGRTVVTQEQWRAVMGTEPWKYYSREYGDEYPAVYVSWSDAVLFCQALTDLEREAGRLPATRSYRLPTEAESEYACRAGTATAYSFGNDPERLHAYGWYGDSSLRRVASKKPNPWGFYDMHGNVNEWCSDRYAGRMKGGNDPIGPSAGTYRAYRGGSYIDGAARCRSAYRHYALLGSPFVGFRVVCCG